MGSDDTTGIIKYKGVYYVGSIGGRGDWQQVFCNYHLKFSTLEAALKCAQRSNAEYGYHFYDELTDEVILKQLSRPKYRKEIKDPEILACMDPE